MSGTAPSNPAQPNAAQPPAGGDPSMEDILASIRRILSEDEPAATPGTSPAAPPAEEVLVLDQSMLVAEPVATAGHPAPVAEPPPHHAEPQAVTDTPVAMPESEPVPLPEPSPIPAPATTLVAPETAAAAANSVDGLVRTLLNERSTQVYRGGPTIEDLVREELRPLLKQWLDINLPPLVERLVRVEIERVVGRATA
jgi:cell pole-organizing protein PopZ